MRRIALLLFLLLLITSGTLRAQTTLSTLPTLKPYSGDVSCPAGTVLTIQAISDRRVWIVCNAAYFPALVSPPTATPPVSPLLPAITSTPTIAPTVEITATATPTATEEITMATLTLQPDATAGIDMYTNTTLPDTANGTATFLDTFPGSANRRVILIKFDVSSIPAGVTVNSATLYLYNGTTVAANRTFELNSILVANNGWDESSTWNYKTPSTVRWAGDAASNGGTDAGCQVSGTDYNATALGTFTYTSGGASDTEHVVSLTTAQVEAWINGANYGAVVRRTDVDNAAFSFRSSDYATDATKRPKLVIEYTAAGVAGKAFPFVAQSIQVWNKRR